MKEISISLLLKKMTEENNYADDIWKTCLNEKGKRYKIKDIKNALKKLEALGFIKKITISRTDTYYNKESYSDPDDYLGFVNNIMFNKCIHPNFFVAGSSKNVAERSVKCI